MSSLASRRRAAAAVAACASVALLSACGSTESPAPAQAPTPTEAPPAETTVAETTVAQALPAHNACALLDPSLLSAAGFSAALQTADINPADLAYEDVLGLYGCGNGQGEIVFDVSLHTSPDAARTAADDSTTPTHPIEGDTRIPFGPERGGAKIINTQIGSSMISWSNGPYSVLFQVQSDPIIRGVSSKHPYGRIDTMIDAVVDHADTILANGNW